MSSSVKVRDKSAIGSEHEMRANPCFYSLWVFTLFLCRRKLYSMNGALGILSFRLVVMFSLLVPIFQLKVLSYLRLFQKRSEARRITFVFNR